MPATQFRTRNDGFANRTRASFGRQEFMAFLGAELHEIGPGTVEIRLPFQQGLTQQHGYFHGGAIGTLADNAGGYAAFTLLAATDSILTVEYKLNIMAPAAGEMLIARGRVLRPGRRVSVCQSDIYCLKESVEVHCASSLGTFMVMTDAADDAIGR